jgi:FixJ family two-component response regulator
MSASTLLGADAPAAHRAHPAHRVLVVEDDFTNRRFLEIALARQGYQVALAEDAGTARAQLGPAAIGSFDLVITDYRMPDHSGLELLAWIQERDPGLATILVTAEGEKRVVSEALRGGAVDFLDKPVELLKLHAAVARAVAKTRRQRRLARSETAAREVGRAQARLLEAVTRKDAVRAEVCFHPRHEAGGDFFSRFRPRPEEQLCLLTDVSGHDLRAAYVSAYFQGLVRGMLERGTPLEEIFATFNRLLLEEWNPLHDEPGGDGETSVAACAILLDTAAESAAVLVQGMPAPVYWLADGQARVVGRGGGFPLGWSPELEIRKVSQPTCAAGSFSFWTDGLQQAAERGGVSELSLAWAC